MDLNDFPKYHIWKFTQISRDYDEWSDENNNDIICELWTSYEGEDYSLLFTPFRTFVIGLENTTSHLLKSGTVKSLHKSTKFFQ